MTPTPDPRAPLPPSERITLNVERLDLEPGEPLLVRVPYVSHDQARAITAHLERLLPGHPVLVLEPGASVEALSREALEELLAQRPTSPAERATR